ncbi:MAG: hypothetical protein U0936_22440 [Planctomycetaceae bacterium]
MNRSFSLASDRRQREALATSTLPGILHVRFFGLDEAIAVTMPVKQRGGAGVFQSDSGGGRGLFVI